MGDWDRFSCSSCAACPSLQKVLGCFEETRQVAEYDNFKYTRCPVTYQDAPSIRILQMAMDETMERMSLTQMFHCPPKRLEALRYVTYLLKLKEVKR